MGFYMNLIFAWIAMITAGLLIVIFFLRVLNKKKKIKWIAAVNRALRKNHKSLGVIMILFGLIHGILSSDKVFSLNLGTLSWVVSILLGLSFVYRKRFKPQKLWMTAHRALTIAFTGLLVVHILDVGGFALDDVIYDMAHSETVIVYAQPSAASTYEPSPTETVYIPETTPLAEDTATELIIEETQAPEPTSTPEPQTKYIDGIYQGTADGFRPGLTVEVEIVNDEIVRVEVIEHNEQKERYWKYPVENMPLWIVAAQSTDVDTVSGATYTSNGIIAATEAALAKALNNN